MKLVVQRVLNGSVSVNNNLVGSINQGVIVLVGFGKNDSIDQSEILFPWAKKHIMNLRLWPDEKEKGKAWKHSVLDKGLGVLLISQFTLYGKAIRGRKPDFHSALNGGDAREMYERLVDYLRGEYVVEGESKSGEEMVQTGSFGEYMNIEMGLDGPVTMIFEKEIEQQQETILNEKQHEEEEKETGEEEKEPSN